MLISALPLFFFLIAAVYASVGLAGGSSYTALLILAGTPYQMVPIVSLIGNMIVSAGGSYHFIRQKHFSWPLLWPFLLTSLPFAYLGGIFPIDQAAFTFILGLTLLLAGMRMLLFPRFQSAHERKFSPEQVPSPKSALPLGAALGFLAGLVGIGGGVFLTPFLYFFGWGRPKQIAATASIFILVNSLAGILGQMQKVQSRGELILDFIPLLVAVFLGGQLGSRLGSRRWSQTLIEKLTGVLIVIVSLKLLN